MGNALSGGATKSILEYLTTHDGYVTCADIRRAYPTVNKNSIHSAFTTLETRGIVTRAGKVKGLLTWRRTELSDVDRAWRRFERVNADIRLSV